MSWSRLQKLSALGGGTGLLCAYFTYFRKEEFETKCSWTTNTIVSPCGIWDKNWDHRDPASLVKPLKENFTAEEENVYNSKLEKHKPTATRHIILIRHGQYNVKGETDVERTLTEVGRIQAKLTGERLKELKIPFDNIFISTMTRAQETGKIIIKSLPEIENLNVENDPLIEEGAPIAPEPKIGHWRPEPAQFFQDGARIEAAFRYHFHRADSTQKTDSYTLLVCHANVIRYFVCRGLQFPPEAWLRLSLHHASISWLTIHPNGRVILRTLGDSGHLPPKYLTVK
jgi:serine/threonine-protein phosphatase PGAM5